MKSYPITKALQRRFKKMIKFIKREWDLFLNDIRTITSVDRLSWFNWFILKPFALLLCIVSVIIVNII